MLIDIIVNMYRQWTHTVTSVTHSTHHTCSLTTARSEWASRFLMTHQHY